MLQDLVSLTDWGEFLQAAENKVFQREFTVLACLYMVLNSLRLNLIQIYLVPRCSIISVVSVDLPLLSNASEAAFLNKTDPAMQPKTVGLVLRSPLAATR